MLHRISRLLLTTGLLLPIALEAVAAPLKPPSAATLLPADTAGVVLLNGNLEEWKALDRFNPYPSFPFPLMNLSTASPELRLVAETQPWLGDWVAFALLPSADRVPNVDKSGVMLIPLTDAGRTRAVVDRIKALRGQPQIERDYKGVTILEWSAPLPRRPSEPGLPQAIAPWQQSFQAAAPLPPPLPAPPTPTPDPLPSPGTLPNPADPFGLGKPRGLAIALLPNHLVVAAQALPLETLIDAQVNPAKSSSLAENPLFQRTVQRSEFERSLLVGYGNVAGLVSYLAPLTAIPPLASPVSPTPKTPVVPPASRDRPTPSTPSAPAPADDLWKPLRETYNSVEAFVWVQPDGIRSQSRFYYIKPQPQVATETIAQPNQIVSRLPAATYLSANSRNFKRQWQLAVETSTDSKSQEALKSIRDSFHQQTGLDFDKDLIGWMDGEYVLTLFPTTGGLFPAIAPNLNLGAALLIQTSDRPAAETLLKKFDQQVREQSRGQTIVANRRVNGQPIVSWEGVVSSDLRRNPKTASFFAYGWLDRRTLLITTGAGAMATLNPKPYQPLDRTFTFQTATQGFPTPNEGFFYVNMGATLSFIYGLAQPYLPSSTPYLQEGQRLLGTIRSLSMASSATAEYQQSDSLWVLAVTRRPKPAVDR